MAEIHRRRQYVCYTADMKLNKPLLREIGGNTGIVLMAAGFLDYTLRQGNLIYGALLTVAGIAMILISVLEDDDP